MARYYELMFLSLLTNTVCGTNFLFLFTGSPFSRKIAIWPLVELLSSRNHNITFVSAHQETPRYNAGVNHIWLKGIDKETPSTQGINYFKIREDGEGSAWNGLYEPIVISLCKKILNSPEHLFFLDSLQRGKFDLVVVDNVFGECGLLLAHRTGAKYVSFVSASNIPTHYEQFGVPLEFSWIPPTDGTFTFPLSIWQRALGLFDAYKNWERSIDFGKALIQAYRKRFEIRDELDFRSIERNTSLVLLNNHFSVDFPKTLPPFYVPIGGMNCWVKSKELTPKIVQFMESAEEGVVLVSFGSQVEFSQVSPIHVQNFLGFIGAFPKMSFIWRYNGSFERKPKNLLYASWLPQQEILAHHNIRAFVTHGGMNSLMEATCHGVPLIVLPLFADQDVNAYKIEMHGIGVKLEVRTLTQDKLESAIHQILTNPKYAKNMKNRMKHFRDRENPVNTAISALEFVLRHEDLSPLKPPKMHSTFWERTNFDVCIIWTLMFIFLPLFILWILVIKLQH